MNLSDYQARALETALPTALEFAYLTPMIMSEVGEMYGKIAKAVRDEWTDEKLKQELTKEYGDVCWGVAVLLHKMGLHEETHGERVCEEPLVMITDMAVDIFANLQLHVVAELWAVLRDNAEKITGSTLDQVLEANLAKLADRKQRGVIGGSGDER